LSSALALVGCSSGHPEARPTANSAIEAAIPSLERARLASADSLDLVLKTAAVIDQKDADGAAGDRPAMQAEARAHPLGAESLRAAGIGLRSGAASYAASVEVLSDAARRSTLPRQQTQALDGLIAAARAEAKASTDLASLAEAVWPSYRSLAELQETWLTRARAGWYRDRKEAADAYAVLTSRVRPAVSVARPKFESAANLRAAASGAYATAVTAFRASVGSPGP